MAFMSTMFSGENAGRDHILSTTITPEHTVELRLPSNEVRRYVISELDVAAAPDPDPPAVELVTFADRPDLADALYALAQIAHPDQPGRRAPGRGVGAPLPAAQPAGGGHLIFRA